MPASVKPTDERILAVQDVAVRQTRQGKDYLALKLADSAGVMQGRKWTVAPEDRELKSGDVIAVTGSEELYQGEPQVKVQSWRRATERERDATDLVPSVGGSLEARWEAVTAAIAGISDPPLRALCERLYADEEALKAASAAKMMHSAGRGGLLEHVAALLAMAAGLEGKMAGVDQDLLVAGIVLHDIGKVREITVEPALDYTVEGRLLGHIVIGAAMVREAAAGLGLAPERLDHLLHLVVSHHGTREFGSPVEPMTATAWALHTLDLLDARLNSLAGAKGEGLFWHDRMRQFVYRPPGAHGAEAEAAPPAAGAAGGASPAPKPPASPPEPETTKEAAPGEGLFDA